MRSFILNRTFVSLHQRIWMVSGVVHRGGDALTTAGETPTLQSRDLFAGFGGMGAFVAAHVDRGDGIPICLSGSHMVVAISWSLQQGGVDFFGLAAFLTTKYVVSAKVCICIGCPEQIHERRLPGTGKHGLEAAGHRGSVNIIGKDSLCRRVIAFNGSDAVRA